ncbi:MAG TPA: hypothetical protein VN874_09950 [Myxococcales bacterium]|jgi:Photosystem II protein Y (PsbY)|nr:hypothetical protein [Myxococcales bacterium]
MKRVLHVLFPLVFAIGWVTTAGYVLSRLASLHDTATQAVHARA